MSRITAAEMRGDSFEIAMKKVYDQLRLRKGRSASNTYEHDFLGDEYKHGARAVSQLKEDGFDVTEQIFKGRLHRVTIRW